MEGVLRCPLDLTYLRGWQRNDRMLRRSMICSVIGKLLVSSIFKSFKRGFNEVTLTWRQMEERLSLM